MSESTGGFDIPMGDGSSAIRPLASTPPRELEVWRNKALRDSLTRGLNDATAGRVHDLGSFAELVCSGCGETYPANEIEGSLHDHWTAADEPGVSS